MNSFNPELDYAEPSGRVLDADRARMIEEACVLVEFTEQVYSQMTKVLPNSFAGGNFAPGMRLITSKITFQMADQLGTDEHTRAWLSRCVNISSDTICLMTDTVRLEAGRLAEKAGPETTMLKLAGPHDDEWQSNSHADATNWQKTVFLDQVLELVNQISDEQQAAKDQIPVYRNS